jgi:hypothetical protein
MGGCSGDRAASGRGVAGGPGPRTAVVAGWVTVAAMAVAAVAVPGTGRDPHPPAAATSTNRGGLASAPGATTLAGTGTPGFGGDGGAAVRARLDAPAGIAVDASGDLLIADAGNCRVREVPAETGVAFGRRVRAGEIVTVVGGPCRGATANTAPSAVAVDADGDLFIASGPGERVDELPATSTTAFGIPVTAGKLTVVAGTGVAGYRGDGGTARDAELDDPTGVAVDGAGDLLIADTGNCRLRLVAATTGTRFGVAMVRGRIYTVAGTGICGSSGDAGPALGAELWDPGALAVDARGDVLVADQGNRSIRVLTTHAGTFYGVALGADDLGTVAGEGSYGPYLIDGLPAVGETAEINFPTALALDAEGNLYIADGAMHAVRFVPAVGTTLLGLPAQPGDMYTAAGALSTGTLHNRTTWIQTRLADPTGLAVSTGGALIFSDAGGDVVRELPPGR